MTAENANEEIRRMILRSGSDETRALLLVLQQLADSTMKSQAALERINDTVEKHQSRFDEHVETFEQHAIDEMALINKGIGGWRMVAVIGPLFLSTVGGLGIYNLSLHVQEINRTMQLVDRQSMDLSAIKAEDVALRALVEQNTQDINRHILGLLERVDKQIEENTKKLSVHSLNGAKK